MKILEISSAYPPSRGGVEMVVSELASRLAARGHEVTVISSTRGLPSRASDVRVGKVRVIRFPERLHLFEAPLLPQIALRALFMDYDVIHVHGMSPTISDLGVLVGKIRRKPVVLTYHNDAESTLDWGIARVAARVYARFSVSVIGLADSVVCSTRSYASTSPALKHFRGRFEVIPLGVDPGRFSSTGATKRLQREGKEILFVGQLKDYKGVSFLIEAISKLRRGGIDVSLDVAGDGPSLPGLVALARELGMGSSVRFRGNVDEETLVSLYDTCDLVVLPSISRREAFGLVQLEASAAGKAVVASDIPGVGEVTRLVGGYLAQPGDVESLAAQLARALGASHDPIRLKDTAVSMSWDVVATEYEELFLSLVKHEWPPVSEPTSTSHTGERKEEEPAPPPQEAGEPVPVMEAKVDPSTQDVSSLSGSIRARVFGGVNNTSISLRKLFSYTTAGVAAVLGGGAFAMGWFTSAPFRLDRDAAGNLQLFAALALLAFAVLGAYYVAKSE